MESNKVQPYIFFYVIYFLWHPYIFFIRFIYFLYGSYIFYTLHIWQVWPFYKARCQLQNKLLLEISIWHIYFLYMSYIFYTTYLFRVIAYFEAGNEPCRMVTLTIHFLFYTYIFYVIYFWHPYFLYGSYIYFIRFIYFNVIYSYDTHILYGSYMIDVGGYVFRVVPLAAQPIEHARLRAPGNVRHSLGICAVIYPKELDLPKWHTLPYTKKEGLSYTTYDRISP